MSACDVVSVLLALLYRILPTVKCSTLKLCERFASCDLSDWSQEYPVSKASISLSK